jgi:hypothetical protein
VSNQNKLRLVPGEHEIYNRITSLYVIVFDATGDFDHITRVICSNKVSIKESWFLIESSEENSEKYYNQYSNGLVI